MEGMQKQALVVDAASQRIWNFACDEGPYLNGTDLAPFPLAYFNSGLGFSLFCEIETLAHARGVRLDDLELCLDSFYGMEGSALKGTMTGSALPPVLVINAKTDLDRPALMQLVADAVSAAPANALLRAALASEFLCDHNDQALEVQDLNRIAGACLPKPSSTASKPMIAPMSAMISSPSSARRKLFSALRAGRAPAFRRIRVANCIFAG
jgi:hypothetical protein